MGSKVASTLASLLAAACAAGCAGRFDPANFQGSREARRVDAEGMREALAFNSELEALGTVQDSCRFQPGFRRLEHEKLSDLDCSTERLAWALRESGASAGGQLLVGLHCSSQQPPASARETVELRCSAQVAHYKDAALARPAPVSALRALAVERPAPSARAAARIDQPDASLGFRIALTFQPLVSAFERRPRSPSEVKELPVLPLADSPLGDLSASCADDCDERALRYGVLVAAGRMGVPDVISVRCFSTGAGNSCVGTLAAPALDEE